MRRRSAPIFSLRGWTIVGGVAALFLGMAACGPAGATGGFGAFGAGAGEPFGSCNDVLAAKLAACSIESAPACGNACEEQCMLDAPCAELGVFLAGAGTEGELLECFEQCLPSNASGPIGAGGAPPDNGAGASGSGASGSGASGAGGNGSGSGTGSSSGDEGSGGSGTGSSGTSSGGGVPAGCVAYATAVCNCMFPGWPADDIAECESNLQAECAIDYANCPYYDCMAASPCSAACGDTANC